MSDDRLTSAVELDIFTTTIAAYCNEWRSMGPSASTKKSVHEGNRR